MNNSMPLKLYAVIVNILLTPAAVLGIAIIINSAVEEIHNNYSTALIKYDNTGEVAGGLELFVPSSLLVLLHWGIYRFATKKDIDNDAVTIDKNKFIRVYAILIFIIFLALTLISGFSLASSSAASQSRDVELGVTSIVSIIFSLAVIAYHAKIFNRAKKRAESMPARNRAAAIYAVVSKAIWLLAFGFTLTILISDLARMALANTLEPNWWNESLNDLPQSAIYALLFGVLFAIHARILKKL